MTAVTLERINFVVYIVIMFTVALRFNNWQRTTVNDKKLKGLKFGEFGEFSLFRQTLFAKNLSQYTN